MSKCDIVIPVWNQIQNTKDCIDSIRKNTKYPYKLIIIDNASDKNTALYLDSLKNNDLTLLRNEENQGFVKAVNRGIRESSSEFLCILNNDTIVANCWLTEMINVIKKNPSVGIVNPSSNTLGQNLDYGESIDARAEDIKHEKGEYVELGSAFGFCMLTKRKIFDEIGLFDEKYGMGYFEDTDFSLRAKQKGYKSVRALAAYVYHKESASFKLLGNLDSTFKKSKKLFESKWGKTKRYAIVMEKISPIDINSLKSILNKVVSDRTWTYVISPYFEKNELYKKYSNLTFYHFKKWPYFYAFFKILFKKKKIDVVYCKKGLFLFMLRIFDPLNRNKIRSL